MLIHELFAQIKSTSGASEKTAIMKENITPLVKQIFADTYGAQKYFVKKFDLPPFPGEKTIENDYDAFHKVLELLTERKVTGNAAIELLSSTIQEFIPEDQEVLASIVDRNLKIGLSADSFNKLLGKAAPKKFEVTLAFNLDKVKGVNPIDGTFFASRKCDGTRCVGMCHKELGQVEITFLSRQNKEFTTLDKVKPALAWYLRNLGDGDYVTDGELCKVDENGDEDFQAIMKEIKKKDWTIEDPCYQMFDFCTLEEFEGKKVSPIFSLRYEGMQKMFEGCQFKEIRLLKQERITCQEDFDRWSKYVEDGNWEGFMLRKDIPFETGRSKNLLKVKKFMDIDAEVKDIEIGEMTTAEPGKGNIIYEGVRALIVEYKGNKVRVGSGLTKEQRIRWRDNPEEIIGSDICIKFFEETRNQNGSYSLRFPILKYAYSGKRDV